MIKEKIAKLDMITVTNILNIALKVIKHIIKGTVITKAMI